jgi:hypothetical protein
MIYNGNQDWRIRKSIRLGEWRKKAAAQGKK